MEAIHVLGAVVTMIAGAVGVLWGRLGVALAGESKCREEVAALKLELAGVKAAALLSTASNAARILELQQQIIGVVAAADGGHAQGGAAQGGAAVAS